MTSPKLAKACIVGVIAFAAVLASARFDPVDAIQCAPYARNVSGINLYGAAWTWWSAASGQYARGSKPEVGAALVFKRLRGMPSGHVAIVTEVVHDRMIKVRHANWVHRGRRGGIETDVAILDESPNNDWSEVRVWYAPIRDFGVKVYPAYGFVYPVNHAEHMTRPSDQDS